MNHDIMSSFLDCHFILLICHNSTCISHIYINNEEVENDFLFIGLTGFRYGVDKISTVP